MSGPGHGRGAPARAPEVRQGLQTPRLAATLFAVAAALGGPAGAVRADLVIRERQTVERPGAAPVTVEATQYSAGNLRVTDTPDARVIVDLDRRRFTVADKRQRTYWTRSLDEVRQQAEEGRRRLAGLPPETRQVVEGMLGGTAVALKPTGRRERIAGHEATEYRLESAAVTGTLWATEEVEDPVGARAARVFSEMLGPAAGAAGPLAEALARIKGLPLRTAISIRGGGQVMTTRTEVLAVERRSVPPDLLRVPEGFTAQAAPPMRPARPPTGPGAVPPS